MRILLALCLVSLSAIPAFTQNTLPEVKIRNLAGKEVSVKDLLLLSIKMYRD